MGIGIGIRLRQFIIRNDNKLSKGNRDKYRPGGHSFNIFARARDLPFRVCKKKKTINTRWVIVQIMCTHM